MRVIVSLVITAMLSFSGDCAAQAVDDGSGNFWKRYCADDFGKGLCLDYIRGVAEFHSVAKVRGMEPFFCIPNGATYGQMKDIVENYMAKHPENTHVAFAALAAIALSEAFPCKR